MSRKRRRHSGSLEADVIACLAAGDAPMTPAEVMVELGGGLAYTTVMTTLSRLFTKGALTRSPRGRAFAYELVGDIPAAQAAVTARQMSRLLEAGDRKLVLSRFVDTLDDEAERELRQLLESAGGAARPQRRGTRRAKP